MEQRIAISHASSIAAEAILEKLPHSGIEADALVLLDSESRAGNRLPYADTFLQTADQHAFDLSSCALLLLPEADTELERAAQEQGCLLVSHALERDTPPLFVGGSTPEPDISYTETSLRLAGPELCCLLPALIELDRAHPLLSVNTMLLRSAEFHGRAGVDELATQTVDLLNAREARPAVYPQQIAFNLMTASVEPRMHADLSHFLGNKSVSVTLQTANVPVFHGFAAAIQLRFESGLALGDAVGLLSSPDDVIVKNGPASPFSDCNQSFSCVISHLEQAPNQPSTLQFWMVADPMRYGLANNYVNVAEFLLKSFL